MCEMRVQRADKNFILARVSCLANISLSQPIISYITVYKHVNNTLEHIGNDKQPIHTFYQQQDS